MPDTWENAYGLDPAIDDAAADPDGEGLSNALEYLYGANPVLADSDGDGYDDRTELQIGTDPLIYNHWSWIYLPSVRR